MRKCRNCLCHTCIKSCKCQKCKGKIKECKRYSGFRQLSIFDVAPKGNMRVLAACEESQRVCIEFRRLGHEAYSCDIEPCSGGHPEWHTQADVLPLLNGNCTFKTVDGIEHRIDGKWDIIIAFPPCTYLTVTGNRWFNVGRYGDKAVQRYKDREQAIKFFMRFVRAACDKVAIENPVGVMSTEYRKPDCIIQPYQFGEPERKTTCLWLKGLPDLQPTKIVEPKIVKCASGAIESNWHMETLHLESKERSKLRSKTFPGIAKAMAEQWGKTEEPPQPKYQKAPRHSWEYYGITKERYRQLTEYIRSGEYASLASQAAHRANKTIARYILLSIEKNLSYDELQKKWELREIERIPCCRTDFYGYRRYSYHLFNEKIKEMGK